MCQVREMYVGMYVCMYVCMYEKAGHNAHRNECAYIQSGAMSQRVMAVDGNPTW